MKLEVLNLKKQDIYYIEDCFPYYGGKYGNIYTDSYFKDLLEHNKIFLTDNKELPPSVEKEFKNTAIDTVCDKWPKRIYNTLDRPDKKSKKKKKPPESNKKKLTKEGRIYKRHIDLFSLCLNHLKSGFNKLENDELFEIVAEDLKISRGSLDSILGKKSSDDLLGDIFNNFCIGK